MNIKHLPQIGVRLDTNPAPGKIEFHPVNSLGGYKAVKILARYKNEWLYSRGKTRDVFEMPGGGVEPGETALEAAKRELYEETGAAEYDIEPAFDFTWRNREGVTNNCQAFYARIHTLGEMPDCEMAEVALCGGVPNDARFFDVLQALFKKMQSWLNVQSAKDELWDLYDANRVKTGRTHRRGDPVPSGEYHLCVLSLLRNTRGEFLITKRAPEKGYAGMWENTGGSAVAGDDSRTAAVRELKEETGIDVTPENGELLFSARGGDAFLEAWSFTKDFELSEVVLQENETVDARFASLEEIIRLIDAGEFLAGDELTKYYMKLYSTLESKV